MLKIIRTLAKTLLGLIACILIILIGYIAYLEISYSRISDNVILTPEADKRAEATELKINAPYFVMTYNIGFGAYTPDYTFFMDTGIMADGTETRGSSGTAASANSVRDSTNGVIDQIAVYGPQFVLLQEVDKDSDRSYHVNQASMIEGSLPIYEAYYASNFHSAFLAYPFNDPHGRVQAGLLTLTTVSPREVVRRSYPIDESFPWKFFDLDRCFSVMRIPTDNERELVLINNHMSAYDEGGVYRAQQLELLCTFMSEEYAQGNYVIVGGDFNHALADSQELYPSEQLVPDWVATFDNDLLPAGFSVVVAENLSEVASCRGDDIPYEKGVTYTVTVDGFVVSDNVGARAINIETEFAYSDHNPVLLEFELLG